MDKIRILVVDDSMFFRAVMIKGLSAIPGFEIVGEAYDPYDARDKILELEPDVMTLDIEMPYMNGVEFLNVLLPQWPIPVIVVSSAQRYAAEAMKAGALDFIKKPEDRSPAAFSAFTEDLARRVRSVAGRHGRYHQVEPPPRSPGTYSFNGIIALGASTGGTQSTGKILKALPGDIPGMVVVQHMPPDFTRMYAENLDRDCALTIKEARDGDQVERGTVLIAPGGDNHMEVIRADNRYRVRIKPGEKVNGHRPSVDTLFNSVAKTVGRNALGIILTGMGADGAQGLLAMRKAGAHTIGQDEASSIVYGMPKEAHAIGAVKRQASLESIAPLILGYCKDQKT
ncbi:chemotaxis response regulator protein-glutamate methylesterase of group 1 operon [Clostridia bacterium]|nr:chemotaxis response regulator protein-glutamate methylesterase of group 1 operon [Clostridia bacterium]